MTRILTQKSTDNMRYVRKLLSRKQPGFSAALELAAELAELELWPLQVLRETRASKAYGGNAALLVAAHDPVGAVAGRLAFLAEAQPADADEVRIDYGWHDGFARDFATADGQRVMVAALSRQQFSDLARTTRLASTFAFLERVLSADFSTRADLHAHGAAIAVLLAPWFSRHTVADLAAAFAGTSVPWARLHDLTGPPRSRRQA